ncbi:MAG: hypothetical protein NC933_05795 [Candidatus Omnitrophica bacterium]|nr:hypothetical protein [Candidatus Omnitrophota bacterium]
MKMLISSVVILVVVLAVPYSKTFAQDAAAKASVRAASTGAQSSKTESAKTEKVAAGETAKASAATEMKELSKEEMIVRLKEMVEYHSDLTSAIPGLAIKEAEGKKYIEYNGKRLEDLDKDTVANVFRAANRYISFKNMQRFQQQMKNLKQIEDMNRMQRQLKATQSPTAPRVPKAYTPPKTYKAPGR